jgi:2,4-dienoyl-CoA reductase-like NADH-dependent reductase (Old Yellow Enzyme family)
MPSAFDPLSFAHGATMANRLMLSPLTNKQSHADGTLSELELNWLTMRAEGGFGMVMTCASHVDRFGQAYPGQLGCWSDEHIPGLSQLASAIKAHGSLAVVQLLHGGRRSPAALIGHAPVAPSEDPSSGARALSTTEVESVVEAFIEAAIRCERAGFDGVEIHGAHDYLLCEFLNASFNDRQDRYGGSRSGRFRIFEEIVEGIRQRCRPDFFLAVRLSPERFDMATSDVIDAFERLVSSDAVDLIDLSLWDCFKEADAPEFSGRPLIELFTEIDRRETRLAVAGHLYSGDEVRRALDLGADVVALGRAGIANHDFPKLLRADPSASMRALPIDRATLVAEGLGAPFIEYMTTWEGFVAD